MTDGDRLILVVDDSPEDYAALERAVRQVGMTNKLFHCEDGEDALDYLYNRNGFSDIAAHPRPSLVMLDLNMPGVDGREVLDVVKKDPALKSIPIIVYSSSSNLAEIRQCYDLGCNCYMQKPLGLDGCVKVMEKVNAFWFNTTILPEVE